MKSGINVPWYSSSSQAGARLLQTQTQDSVRWSHSFFLSSPVPRAAADACVTLISIARTAGKKRCQCRPLSELSCMCSSFFFFFSRPEQRPVTCRRPLEKSRAGARRIDGRPHTEEEFHELLPAASFFHGRYLCAGAPSGIETFCTTLKSSSGAALAKLFFSEVTLCSVVLSSLQEEWGGFLFLSSFHLRYFFSPIPLFYLLRG